MIRKLGVNDARFMLYLPHQDKAALFDKANELNTTATDIARELIQGFLRGDIKLPSEDDNKPKGG